MRKVSSQQEGFVQLYYLSTWKSVFEFTEAKLAVRSNGHFKILKYIDAFLNSIFKTNDQKQSLQRGKCEAIPTLQSQFAGSFKLKV